MGQNYYEHDAGECDSWCGWCYQEFIEMEKLAHDSDIGAGEIEYEEIYEQKETIDKMEMDAVNDCLIREGRDK